MAPPSYSVSLLLSGKCCVNITASSYVDRGEARMYASMSSARFEACIALSFSSFSVVGIVKYVFVQRVVKINSTNTGI